MGLGAGLERAVTSSRKAFRKWSWVHKWTSLICTLFLLMLCVTGLPLIFHQEIDHLLHEEVKAADVPAGTPKADLDRVVAAGMARYPVSSCSSSSGTATSRTSCC